jgi:hypothetical protein
MVTRNAYGSIQFLSMTLYAHRSDDRLRSIREMLEGIFDE